MALYGMSDNGVEIPAEVDGALFNFLSGNTDYVIGGIGDEFGVTYSSGSLTVTLGTGIGVLCGRTVQESDGATTLELPSNSNGFIVIRFDKSLEEGSQVSLKAVSEVTREDINDTGTVADLELYEFVTNASGVTSFIDNRNVQTEAGGGGGKGKYVFPDGSSFKWSDVVWDSSGVTFNTNTMIPIAFKTPSTSTSNAFHVNKGINVKYGGNTLFNATVYNTSSSGTGLSSKLSVGASIVFVPLHFNALSDMTGKELSAESYSRSSGSSTSNITNSVKCVAYIPR